MFRRLAIAACFVIALLSTIGGPARADGQASSLSTTIGEPKLGIAVGLASASTTYRLNEPISVTVELRNVSDKTRYMLLGFKSAAFRFSIADLADGKVISRDPSANLFETTGGPNTGYPLEPRHSEFTDYPLSFLYKFNRVGTYAVTVDSSDILMAVETAQVEPVDLKKSNTLTIKIVP
jgi:hypothetical protein